MAFQPITSFSVMVSDEKPRHAFDVIEMQGEVTLAEPGMEANPLPSPMGALLVSESGKGCTLRMATLSLAGEMGNVKVPMLVLRRVGEREKEATKRPREAPLESMTPMLLSDAWKQGLLEGDDSASAPTEYEIVGTVRKRYHFKSKATRQFNK